MGDKKTKRQYSDEVNNMLGLRGELLVDFTKLKPNDLYSLYFFLKTKDEMNKAIGDGKVGVNSVLDLPVVKRVMADMDAKDLEKIKERFPILASAAERVLSKK